MRKSRIVSFVLAVVLGLSLSGTAFAQAAEVSEQVSYDEYCAAMQNVFREYGVEGTPVSEDHEVYMTREMMDQSLNYLRNQLEQENLDALDVADVESVESQPASVARVAPVNYTRTSDTKITFKLGSCKIRTEAKLTVDVANDMVMSVNSCTSYVYGASVNVSSWTHLGYSVVRRDYGSCQIKVKGRIASSYTDPITGTAWQQTENKEFTTTIYV